ncbi:TetR family transcriptional regulator [Sphaerisporangium siamense]|uniref:AcrR family transcriptional regulator n=1 Tax=Sphaerisporangium siamense TaxID=795645 RepID=A0A7W7D4Z1_9ACTN|nr:TetR/AcrR family transcriptional regulator [Sphaerisporangium siamense]MBB4700201.1 AcrR family transcriptional regulator [Sphaerisporangium siamense]GII84486.1 TetR family transcriptional regulator [Sphaerisporangium siamense]
MTPEAPDGPGGPSGVAAERPLRADARRNRARVLRAADAVFAAKGAGASTEEVAREAGVGIGTVFRHFPTKEALLTAVLVDRLRRLADEAEAQADAEDPGGAFFRFFARVVDQGRTKNTFTDLLRQAGVDVRAETAAYGARVSAAVAGLLVRAQRAGAVREDAGVAEVLALMAGAARAAEHAAFDDEVRARALAIVFDGLRPAR